MVWRKWLGQIMEPPTQRPHNPEMHATRNRITASGLREELLAQELDRLRREREAEQRIYGGYEHRGG